MRKHLFRLPAWDIVNSSINGEKHSKGEKGTSMASYLFQVAYTADSWATMVNNPQDRAKGIETAVKNLGGKIERFWLSFGDFDVIGVFEMPDSVSAAAFAMAVAAGGSCKNVKTTPLLSTHEGIEAMKKASACGYQPVAQRAGGAGG